MSIKQLSDLVFTQITFSMVSHNTVRPCSISYSVLWDDCEGVLVAGAGEVRVEDVVCLCEVVAVSTGHGCWVVLVCHIGDEDRVPDVRVHPTHIQRERSTP